MGVGLPPAAETAPARPLPDTPDGRRRFDVPFGVRGEGISPLLVERCFDVTTYGPGPS